jgi:deoxyadenosine/deoxycytidine kinase
MLNVGLPLPQLIVYLQKEIPSLQKNIKKRGRDYEQNMKDDYLLKINNAYGRFMKRAQKSSNILIINTEGLDFVR